MSFSLAQINEDKLIIRHKANYTFAFISAFFLVVFALAVFSSDPNSFEILLGTFLLWCAFSWVWNTRELKIVIDKRNGFVRCQKGGLLETQFDTKESSHNLALISRLEVKRFVARWADTFQIRAIIDLGQDSKVEILLSNTLKFSEATQYAEQIHQFLGKEIPLKAVD